jgi:hypothetical protein
MMITKKLKKSKKYLNHGRNEGIRDESAPVSSVKVGIDIANKDAVFVNGVLFF